MVADKLWTICVRTACSQLLEQVRNKLLTTCKKLDSIIRLCYKVVLTNLIQSRYNKNVTRLTTQACNNIVMSWLYRTCWNNLATSLIISTSLLQVVNNNSLGQVVGAKLGTSNANTTCWRLVGRLATRCMLFACVHVISHFGTQQKPGPFFKISSVGGGGVSTEKDHTTLSVERWKMVFGDKKSSVVSYIIEGGGENGIKQPQVTPPPLYQSADPGPISH